MGDAAEGGGGSVRWRLEVDNSGEADYNHRGRRVQQTGTDEDGAIGTDFTVSVEVPQGVDPDEFLRHLKDELQLTNNRQRVYFNHPIIEKRYEQILVSWGNSKNHAGNGGKKTLFSFTGSRS